MPWCTDCDRFLSPSTVTVTGTCPRCGSAVDPGRARAPETAAPGGPTAPEHPSAAGSEAAAADEETPVPLAWHFKLLVAAIALYLLWRAVQGVDWLLGQF